MALSVAVIAGSLGYLAVGKFGENLVYFVTPSEVAALSPDQYGKKMRLAGLVVKESLHVVSNSTKVTFALTDGAKTIPVVFEGIPPDLFKEGQGAVVEGRLEADQTFYSTMIMAKHSEDYMPIEMKRAGLELPKKDFFKTLQME